MYPRANAVRLEPRTTAGRADRAERLQDKPTSEVDTDPPDLDCEPGAIGDALKDPCNLETSEDRRPGEDQTTQAAGEQSEQYDGEQPGGEEAPH